VIAYTRIPPHPHPHPSATSRYNASNFNGKGWKDGEKRREIKDPESRFIFAMEPSIQEPMGYLMYRILIEDDQVCFYVYARL
jgi:hypothetical protein